MKENRIDYSHRSRKSTPPNYHHQQHKRRQEEAYHAKRHAEEEYKRHTETQRKMGARMQRNRQMQAEMRRKRRTGVILLFVILVLIGIIGFAAVKLYASLKQWESKAEQSDFVATAETPAEADEMLNIAIFGTDKDGFRTDVNIIASFHTKDQKLSLISVPRDIRVTMTDDMISYLEEHDRTVPERNGVYGQCKLTEVHAYAGEGNRCTFSVAMLESLLNIDIDYYVKIDLDAFKELVDAMGGIEFNVEERLYYSDPEQGLYIDLYPGLQTLDGEKAEMLVRYRSGYAQGDIKRIEVQQAFLQAMIEQLSSSDTLLKNLDSLIKIGLEKSETNMPLSEALHYAPYVAKLNPATVTMDTVPGEGGAYYDLDEEGTKTLIDYRIYGIEPPVSTEDIYTDDTNGSNSTNSTNNTNSTNGTSSYSHSDGSDDSDSLDDLQNQQNDTNTTTYHDTNRSSDSYDTQ